MYIYRCKMCGGTLNIQKNETIVKCEYCETKQTVPRILDEEKAALYERANYLRTNSEFDKAIEIYEKLLMMETNDSEIYWLLVLCKYGVEYVEDPQTRKHIPTINRLQYTSIYSDENYKMALQCADSSQKDIYEEQAKEIDRVQKEILKISQQEEPFDVFICYKETDNNGRRTYDSVLANELYHELKKEGFRVFFSRITLEDKLGIAYEPYIFAALNSSKVMVVIGTKKEHFEAVWVKNEWSRYLSLIKKGEKKILIPAYKDIDPYHLPEEFSHLQAQDMSKLGFMQDLTRAISKMINRNKPTEKVSVNSFNPTVEPLLKRIQMFLEDGAILQAKEYVERVLDLDPENAQAYLYKLMFDLNITKKEQFKILTNTFDQNPNYKKVMKFGDNKIKQEIEEYNSNIKKNIIDDKYQKALKVFETAKNANDYHYVAKTLRDIEYYKDSTSLIEQSKEKVRIFEEKEKQYLKANNLINETYITRGISEFTEAINIFSNIKDYKDSNNRIRHCEARIASLKEKQKRLEEERIKQEKLKEKRDILRKKLGKLKGLLIASLVALCIFIGVVIYLNTNIVVDGLVLSRDKKTLVSYEDIHRYTKIPNSVLYIDEDAFRGCGILSKVTFEEGSKLESIGASAFRDCINLVSIEIPNTVKSIGDYAFCYCKKLTNFTIPDSVKNINKGAFYGCKSLKIIEIPNSVTVIGPDVFANCPDLKIRCEAQSKPTSWDNTWNPGLNEVIWGWGDHKLKHYNAKEATCTTAGNIEYWKCTKCNKYFSDNEGNIEITYNNTKISAKGHNYTSTVTKPTCKEDGYTQHTCKECGNTYKDTYVDALGHNYVTKTIPATCTEYGYTQHTCTLCGIKYTNASTPKIDHNYVNNKCTMCGKEKEQSQVSLKPYEENGKTYINFGRYPQTVVTDTNLINELDKITKTNEFGYIEYNGNEYKKQVANPYYSHYTFKNGNTIQDGATYYFLVEPIKWRVLETTSGGYKLLSEYILDTQQFYTSLEFRTLNGKTIYPNNYEYSTIRAWLNGYNGTSYGVEDYTNKGFLDIAFTEEEQELIKTTLVDNSLASTKDSSNIYICNNTIDKIYLLSRQEVKNTKYGFSSSNSSDSNRESQPTDYALARFWYMYQGNGFWWLRSPDFSDSYFARNFVYYGYGTSNSAESNSDGVRAALEINLTI